MRKMMTTVHNVNGEILQFTKGAPDVILDRCTHILQNGVAVELTPALREEVLAANKDMADRALRVLAVGQKRLTALPEMLINLVRKKVS